LRLRDWPGLAGPLVHLPDPFAASELIDALASRLAPRVRVLSLSPRVASTYQVDAADALGMVEQFGFESPVLLGERLGCVAALLLAAWYPGRVGGLILFDATDQPPPGDSVAARALRECPPRSAALRQAVRCRVLEVDGARASIADDVGAFLAATLP
jgi:pimeloyl-ACP methyl ester carboxylesterase